MKLKRLILILSLVAVVLLPAPASAFTIFGWSFSDLFGSSLNRGLVGHWTFDGKHMVSNVADASGNGNNGMLSGQTATTSVMGVLGQALKFDGTDDKVVDSTPVTTQTENVTLSAWFRTDDYTQDRQPIVYNGNGATSGYGVLLNQEGGGTGRIMVLFGGVAWNNTLVDITDSKWHHIVLTLSSGAPPTKKVYLDGVLIYENSTGTPAAPTTGTAIGNDNQTAAGTPYFRGAIDDVRVYNRAISAEEAKRLYKMGAKGAKAGTVPAGGTLAAGGNSGLVGHWTFDGKNLISNVTDSSGQGNTGRLILGATGNTATTTGMGVLGQALVLDGVNDYISVPGLTWTPTTFSVSWWVNPSTCTNYNQAIMAANGWGRFAAHTTTLCEMYVGIDQSSAAQRFTNTDLPAGTFTLNTWQLFTFTFDNGDAAIYKNGVLLASKTGMPNPSAWTGFSIGQNTTGTINGLVDDVRIYNRALSAEEVKRLYSTGASSVKSGAAPSGGTLSATGGLVGHWTFDGKHMISNVADASGNGNNGSLILGATGNTATTSVIGRIGQALVFDGTNDYITMGDKDEFSPERITVSAWVRRGATDKRIVSKDADTGGSRDYELKITGSDTVEFTIWNQAGTLKITSGGSAVGDGWHHVAGTWDGTTVRTYLDGVEQATGALSGTSVRNTGAALEIGRHPTQGEWFNGAIDDVRIYNRALSAEEIKRLYTMGQ